MDYSSSVIVISFDTIPADSLQNLFYTPIFLFQMPSFFDKGRFLLELCIK
jgi:hypothetical protein